ncbi:general stress protein [Sporosarcina sp. ACRSL]|uniref:general stress protein n=1 Tax=Sporosarcina sp. ACRSL TaxID=2918215 RepID=UPI001EF432EE|nr:general stress protein [Sporosarcina sp. ACRSL]MCG7344185.1 general stress protein [Sporosarcina sp. ACRSL]
MTEKTFVGLYDTETSLLAAMKELDEKGIAPENMYVIAKNEDDVQMLRRRTSEDIQSAPSNWLDRFIGYISDENHVRSMLVEVGFDEADLRRYEAEIKSGKWLLYVDDELEKSTYEINAERHQAETNPFNQPVSEAERLNKSDDDSPVGIGKDGLPKNEYRDSILSDSYEGVMHVVQEDLLFGKVGAEVLFDRSEYEPNPPNVSSPSQIRGTPSGERAQLHRAAMRERESDRSDVIPDPRHFMESQMDRQDAMVDPIGPNGLDDSHSRHGNYSANRTETKKPIVIDLRNVGKEESNAETWLKPKNQDRNRDK